LTERLPTEYSESELALLRLEYRTRALQAEVRLPAVVQLHVVLFF
jgi:hypothetical protein